MLRPFRLIAGTLVSGSPNRSPQHGGDRLSGPTDETGARHFAFCLVPSIAEPVPKWTGPPVQTKRRRETSAAFLLSPQGFGGLAAGRGVSGRPVVITSRVASRRDGAPIRAKVPESLLETRARVMTGLVSL